MSKIFKLKILFSFLKLTFNLFCSTVLTYQLIDITNKYLEFSHEVKLEIIDDYYGIDLPSITFCLRRDDFWNKHNFENKISYVNNPLNYYNFDKLCKSKCLKVSDKTADQIIKDENITSFYQLFDITVNLSSILKCSLISLDANHIVIKTKCELLGTTAEFLSKSSNFEKCLTFFNINYRNESFRNYEFNKWSAIEIEFLGKNNFSDLLYLSIHSSQSIFKTTFFYPINFGADSEEKFVYSFKFSKSFVRILEWPHETNCFKNKSIYESNGKIIHSFQDCINSCILRKIFEKNKCIQKEGILGLNIELNEKTKKLKVCENLTQNSTIIKIEKLCSRKCSQNCINEYIDVYLQQKKENSNKTISIQSANTPIFVYELNPKLSFINYASNIGSIILMWFSFAVIDVHKAIKKIITFFIYVSRKIYSKLNIENYLKYVSIIIEALVVFNKYFIKFMLKLKKVNWNF
jgi:hypothetical protein